MIKAKLYLCEFLFLMFLKQEVCSFLRSRKGDEQTITKFKEQKVIILRQQIHVFYPGHENAILLVFWR